MTAPAIPTREDISAAWLLCGNTFDVELALARRADMLARTSIEATCAACGDQCDVPGDEDPEDTLCAVCADEEQNGVDYDDPDVCGCDDCLRKEAIR